MICDYEVILNLSINIPMELFLLIIKFSYLLNILPEDFLRSAIYYALSEFLSELESPKYVS